MAKADKSEMAILPMAITSALIRLVSSIGATAGSWLPNSFLPPNSARQ